MKALTCAIFLAVAAAPVSQCGLKDSGGRTAPKVFAHYMPWFRAERLPDGQFAGAHWQWEGKGPKHDPDDMLANGHRDIASVFYPLTGPYDERDPVVLEYQVLTAKTAGIDGFIADWYGPADFSDKVFASLMKTAECYRFQVAICLEEKTWFPPYSKAKSRLEAQQEMARQIRYVLDRYATSPSYFRWNSQPVVLVFAGFEQGPLGPNTLSPEELSAGLAHFKDRGILFTSGTLGNSALGVAEGCYLWAADGRPRVAREAYYESARAARERGAIQFLFGGVCPGFNDTGVWGWGQGPRVTDRRGMEGYREQWQEVLRYRPDAVQIATWNDLEEGTTIEPTEQYRFSYVDLTEQFVEKYTGRRASLGDNEWPYRLYKLRRAVGSVEDVSTRQDWTRRLDQFAERFARGKRFLMGWELSGLEREMDKLTQKLRDGSTGGQGK